MLDLYQSGDLIPEFGAPIHGGIAVIMHHPDEMRYARAVCALTADSNAPLHAIYGMLNAERTSPESWSVLENVRISDNTDWQNVTETELSHDGHALSATLSFAHHLWIKSPLDLNVALAVARPDSPDGGALDISRGKAALVLHRGSIIATLALTPLRVLKFAVILFPASVIAPSQSAEQIMEELRSNALGTAGGEQLVRLDSLPNGVLQRSKGVIIFLHGLLSIDIGLFDEIIRLLRQDKRFGTQYALVGWPHDTLTSIDTNGFMLRRLVEQKIGTSGPDVAFVCHSRGGLVARSAAVQLCEKNRKWIDKLRGCVTFGTPHEGCPLAEAPHDFLGLLIAVQSAFGTGSFFSLFHGLAYASRRSSIDGITDLRPMSGGGKFLKDLLEREGKLAPEDKERALQILAIGGRATQKGILAWITRHMLAGSDNDLVVETRSSTPQFIVPQEQTNCDHFSYFTSTQVGREHINKAVDFLAGVFCHKQVSEQVQHLTATVLEGR